MLKTKIKGFTLAETIVAMVISLLLVFLIFESVYFFSSRASSMVKDNRTTEDLFLFKADAERLFDNSSAVVQRDNSLLFYDHDTVRATYVLEKGERVIRRAGLFTDTLGLTVEDCRVFGPLLNSSVAVDSVALALSVGNLHVRLTAHRILYSTTLFSRDIQLQQ